MVSLKNRPLKLISVQIVKSAFVRFLRSQLCNLSTAMISHIVDLSFVPRMLM